MIHDFDEKLDTRNINVAVDTQPDDDGNYWVMLGTMFTVADSIPGALERLALRLEELANVVREHIAPEWEEGGSLTELVRAKDAAPLDA